MAERIAIVGGGASGILTASLLLKHSASDVIVIEPGALGRGIAYSTTYRSHLLNVPALKMSAFVDDEKHFLAWLERCFPAQYGPTSFVPRSIYGTYLADIAAGLKAADPQRFTHVTAVATDIDFADERLRVMCSDQQTVIVDCCVLATGHSTRTRAYEHRTSSRYFSNAWAAGALVPAVDDDPVAILGSGLTAVDAILALRENGHRGRISLISTRGLLPHEHRIPSDEADWRTSVDALRPLTNARWQAMTLAEQRRFLRHFAAYWNVHRHRMAPQIAREIAQLLANGTVQVIAGRVRGIEETGSALRVEVRRRGTSESCVLNVARFIDCTGPEQDLQKTSNPLVRALLDRGVLTPHPLGLGSQVTGDGALIDRDGNVSTQLYAIGPLRFGALFETTAIPEIRVQARQLAHMLQGSLGRAGIEPACSFERQIFAPL